MTNTALWDALCRTDPAHTKQFSRAGGFKGTAIKPIWIVRRLTEKFGPVGIGWGMGEPQFQVVPVDNEVLVFCTVRCWHTHPDNGFYGVGGDKVTTKRQSGAFNDDEAFKKAFTDAVGNGFKFIGVGADVHMGQFEDSKYLREVARDFAEGRQAGETKPVDGAVGSPAAKREMTGPYKSKTALETAIKGFVAKMDKVSSEQAWMGLQADYPGLLEQAENDHPDWWNGWDGMPDRFIPLSRRIEILEANLAEYAAGKAQHMADLARV